MRIASNHKPIALCHGDLKQRQFCAAVSDQELSRPHVLWSNLPLTDMILALQN